MFVASEEVTRFGDPSAKEYRKEEMSSLGLLCVPLCTKYSDNHVVVSIDRRKSVYI